MTTNPLRKIRVRMGYSVREFAKLLGYKDSTYQHYESGFRTMKPEVLTDAIAAFKRDRRFFYKGMKDRMRDVKPFLSVEP